MKSIIYIGMDVHKNTYSLCAINNSTGEVLGQTKCESDVKNIIKFIASVKEKFGNKETAEILTGYEAGCLGFSLYHELNFHDIPCHILAPSTMHGSYKAVHIPTEHDNEIKEYIGLREDAVLSRKKIKQQISALALRYGKKYEGKATGQLPISSG